MSQMSHTCHVESRWTSTSTPPSTGAASGRRWGEPWLQSHSGSSRLEPEIGGEIQSDLEYYRCDYFFFNWEAFFQQTLPDRFLPLGKIHPLRTHHFTCIGVTFEWKIISWNLQTWLTLHCNLQQIWSGFPPTSSTPSLLEPKYIRHLIVHYEKEPNSQ